MPSISKSGAGLASMLSKTESTFRPDPLKNLCRVPPLNNFPKSCQAKPLVNYVGVLALDPASGRRARVTRIDRADDNFAAVSGTSAVVMVE